jgi:NitT/TauT family transport system substrate-binding protein
VTSAFDILGGPATLITFTSTTRFKTESPVTYAAVAAALDEARDWINADRRRAAALYLEITKERRTTLEELEGMISGPGFAFGKVPHKIGPQADFMARTGVIKTRPASWKDLFFAELHDQPGD